MLKRILSSDRSRGLLAIFDQMLVSGTNFVTVALVGRIGGSEALGLFTIGMSALVIVATALRSLVVTPYSVFAPRSGQDERRRMRGATLVYHGFLASLVTLVLIIAAALYRLLAGNERSDSVFWMICIIIVTLPSWVLRDLARQMSFADLKFFRAIAIDASQSILQLSIIGAIAAYGQLTASTALIAVAIAIAISAASVAPGLGWLMAIRNDVQIHASSLRTQWSQTWRFGRWGAMSQLSHVIQGYIVSWIVAISGGLAATGLYAAMWSIVSLANPFIQGIGNAVGPMLAKRYAESGIANIDRFVKQLTVYAIGPAICFPGLTYLLGPWLMNLVYGDAYGPSAATMAMLAASVSVSALQLVVTKAISVLQFPQANLVLNLITLILTTILATTLGIGLGIAGAAAGLMIAAAIGTIIKWFTYLWLIRNDDRHSHRASERAPKSDNNSTN